MVLNELIKELKGLAERGLGNAEVYVNSFEDELRLVTVEGSGCVDTDLGTGVGIILGASHFDEEDPDAIWLDPVEEDYFD